MKVEFPNLKQIHAARDCLREVLVRDQQLCGSVEKIEYAGQIERFGELHYIFKFREPGGPWLVGVAGGYTSKDQIEPGDYVGSMGDAYNEATAKGCVQALLDDMKSFMAGEDMQSVRSALDEEDVDAVVAQLKEMAEKSGFSISEGEIRGRVEAVLQSAAGEEAEEGEEELVQEILLDRPSFDWDRLIPALKERWGLEASLVRRDAGTMEFCLDVSASVYIELSSRVPDRDVLAYSASSNYTWLGAQRAAAKGRALLRVAVSRPGGRPFFWGPDLVKVVDACLAAAGPSAIGVWGSDILHRAEDYRRMAAECEKSGSYPVECLIWMHLEPGEGRDMLRAFTSGMEQFGLRNLEFPDDMPIVAAGMHLGDLYGLALKMAETDYMAEDGELFFSALGLQYQAKDVPGRYDGEHAVELRAVRHLLMDADEKIRFLLKEAGLRVRKACRMNRAGYFLRWARDRGFLRAEIEREIDAFPGGDLREYLIGKDDGMVSAGLLNREAETFAARYYNLAVPDEAGSYVQELAAYTKARFQGTRKAESVRKAGLECPVFLPWDDETYAAVRALLDASYEAWKCRGHR